MVRKLRIQCPGAIYYMMNRGDHQETIFSSDSDPKLFLSTLAEGCRKTAWQIHRFCLMSKQLSRWRKGHPFKVKLAAKLRAETTVTVCWVAERLAMGTRGHLAHLLSLSAGVPAEPALPNQPALNI